MKKIFFIFLRVAFVILTLLGICFFSLKYYFQFESNQAIEKALDTNQVPILGDKNSSFTIVEFFDYRCAHCPTLAKIVDDAVGNDQEIKILLRPTVMNDEQSYKIALLVLAADQQKQGATLALHKDIMNLPSLPDYNKVKAIAESKGLDVAQLEKDGESFKSIIARNTSFVAEIGFYAVPALIIGDKGFVPIERMPGVNELRLMIIDAKTRLQHKNK